MNVREYALDTLEQIVCRHGYANLLLRQNEAGLSEQDMALASELVYGTMRNYSFLEYQWKHMAPKARPRTEILLNMSIYQLQFLDRIPSYAVIAEAGKLSAKRDEKFVNAILHRVLEQGQIQPHEQDDLADQAILTSHPLWLLKLWSSHYGKETALAIAAGDQQRPEVYGRLNTLKLSREQLAKEADIHFVNDLSFTFDGVLARTEWFRSGAVVIQDLASAEIPLLLDPQPGMRVLDTCAAPGTKTQETAMLMRNEGEIDAFDLYPNRIRLIDELMAATGVSIVKAAAADASVPNPQLMPESFDRILIDAPCSGLGDLCHKPEIRMHVTPESLDELAALQARILEANAGFLKPGGIMVYSTCTLNRKENEMQVQRFLKAHPEMHLETERTWLPFERHSDGFYTAKIRKGG